MNTIYKNERKMYDDKKIIGFVKAYGTKWCKKDDKGNNIEVALVKKNGDIIWYLSQKNQPEELLEKIMKNSLAEKKKINLWKKELKKTEKLLEVVKKGSYEHLDLLHDYFWYKDALVNANVSLKGKNCA